MVPASEGIELLQREAGLLGMASVMGVVRARDAFTMTPRRHIAWHLAGALFHVMYNKQVHMYVHG